MNQTNTRLSFFLFGVFFILLNLFLGLNVYGGQTTAPPGIENAQNRTGKSLPVSGNAPWQRSDGGPGCPRIDSVYPLAGSEGDVIAIDGCGFSADPTDTWVTLGGHGAAGEVLSGSPTSLQVGIRPIPQIQSGKVSVYLGQGQKFSQESVPILVGDEVLLASVTVSHLEGAGVSATSEDDFVLANSSPNTTKCGAVTTATGDKLRCSLFAGWPPGIQNIQLDVNWHSTANVIRTCRVDTGFQGPLPAGVSPTTAAYLIELIINDYCPDFSATVPASIALYLVDIDVKLQDPPIGPPAVNTSFATIKVD